MVSLFSQYFVYYLLIYFSPISFILVFLLFSISDEYIDFNYKIGWDNINHFKEIKYGKICISRLSNSTYYEVPGVCSLKCDLIPIPFPSKSFEKCLNQRKVIKIYNNSIIALEDVKIIFTNTYYFNSHKNNKGEKTKIFYEYIKVQTRDVDDVFLHFIPTKLNKIKTKIKKYNINLYLFDGLSRSIFNEEMNDTISFLNSIIDDFDIFEFFRYHTIGLNSEPNYISIFYGTTKNKAKWLNEYDDLFNKIYKYNYKSLFFDPSYHKRIEFFHPYKSHKGFDHDIHLAYNKEWIESRIIYSNLPRCIGSKQIHEHYLKFQEEAMKYYHKHKQLMFSLNIFSESHDVYIINLFLQAELISLTRVDSDFAEHLKGIKEVMKDSITIIFGDHGIHYGKLYRTEYDENDRALPAMIIIVPKSFSQSYPSIYNNMRINQNRFSTHFEFHETINDIIRINEGKYVNSSKYSLFREIPKSYSCEKANVDYYCACR